MKKYIGIIVMAAMLLLTACGQNIDEKANNSTGDTAAAKDTTSVSETEETTVKSEPQSETEADTTAPETKPATESETETDTTVSETEPTTEAETVTVETTAAEANEIFALNGPLGRYQGVEEFNNAKFAASFGSDSLTKNWDGSFTLTTMIYRYEMFSEDDIQSLKVGDTIWCLGKAVVVETIKTLDSGLVIVNEGIENGGRCFRMENGVYCESGMNNVHSYYEIGKNTYMLSADFVFTDNSDMDNPKTYTAEEFMALLAVDTHFIKSNTIVETTDGVVTAIVRNYIP